MYKIEYYGASEIGRRERNEDSFHVFHNSKEFLVAVIADGMGGHKGGETASKSVIKMVKKEFAEIDFGIISEEEIKKTLLNIVRKFQKKLKRIGEEYPEFMDMGSTMNLNVFVGNKIYTINIGDSRTQSFVKRHLIKITEDHNLGTLAEKDERYAHYKGQNNMLTSSLGPNKKTTADLFVTELESKKGYILMTTDGVHNYVSDSFLIKTVKSSRKKIEQKVNKVIKASFEKGSNDNMTFILIRYER